MMRISPSDIGGGEREIDTYIVMGKRKESEIEMGKEGQREREREVFRGENDFHLREGGRVGGGGMG